MSQFVLHELRKWAHKYKRSIYFSLVKFKLPVLVQFIPKVSNQVFNTPVRCAHCQHWLLLHCHNEFKFQTFGIPKVIGIV